MMYCFIIYMMIIYLDATTTAEMTMKGMVKKVSQGARAATPATKAAQSAEKLP